MTKTKSHLLAKILGACVVILISLSVLFAISIPIVNNCIADGVEDRLLSLPLPEGAELVDSLSIAAKVSGNGNGMQYFGAILIKSDLPIEEVDEHYANFRNGGAEDCRVRLQEGKRIEFLDLRRPEFNAEMSEDEQYYVISAWGDGIGIYEELDLRGH